MYIVSNFDKIDRTVFAINGHLNLRLLVTSNSMENQPFLLPRKYLACNYQGHALFSYATQTQSAAVYNALCKRHRILLPPRGTTVTCTCIHWRTVNSMRPGEAYKWIPAESSFIIGLGNDLLSVRRQAIYLTSEELLTINYIPMSKLQSNIQKQKSASFKCIWNIVGGMARILLRSQLY